MGDPCRFVTLRGPFYHILKTMERGRRLKQVEGNTVGAKIGQLEQMGENAGGRPVDPYRLFEEHQGLAYGALRRYFPGYAADEDLRQQACLALWDACLRYDPGRGSFSTWGYRTVRDGVLDHLRNQRSQKRRAATVSLDRPEIRKQLPVSRDGIGWMDTEGFYRALGRERYRRIVSLRQEGLDNREIAHRLGVDRSTVTKDLDAIRRIFEAYI